MTMSPDVFQEAGSQSASGPFEVRLLEPADIEQLMILEKAKWTHEQATSGAEMLRRMAYCPRLSIGAFSSTTGQALVSAFLRPITAGRLERAQTWADCARIEQPLPEDTRLLFGISLSSIDADAVTAVLQFLCPRALVDGFRYVYLGSPLPGLREWRNAHPETPVEEYVWGKRHDLPRDPQLRYYHGRGFTTIEACKPDYFPHAASLDYGAVIRGDLRDMLKASETRDS